MAYSNWEILNSYPYSATPSEPNLTRVVETTCGAKVVVVKRTQPGFEVLPKRWVVDHTFGWFNRYCRLSKDYELLPEVNEVIIYSSMVRLMLRVHPVFAQVVQARRPHYEL
jgi:Transposase and inactivated derivatives